MTEEVKSEINRILYMAGKAVDCAERFGGPEARGWAKSVADVIKSDIEARYPGNDFLEA